MLGQWFLLRIDPSYILNKMYMCMYTHLQEHIIDIMSPHLLDWSPAYLHSKYCYPARPLPDVVV